MNKAFQEYRVYVLEDDPGQLDAIEHIFNDLQMSSYFEGNPDRLKEHLAEIEQYAPDLLLSDICLEGNDFELIKNAMKSLDNMADLSNISGVSFLSWIRHRFPHLPVVLMSAYWKDDFPPLNQHALGVIPKSEIMKETQLAKKVLQIAARSIFGMFLPKRISSEFVEKARALTREINNGQGSFYFHIAQGTKDLVLPPDDFLPESGPELQDEKDRNRQNLLLFESWCKRILGVVVLDEPSSCQNASHTGAELPVIPFGRAVISGYQCDLMALVKYMGDDYFEAYLLREYLRTIYRVFFFLEPHRISGEKCLFDDTQFIETTLAREDLLCGNCREKVENELKKSRSWSVTKLEAVDYLCEKAQAAAKQAYGISETETQPEP